MTTHELKTWPEFYQAVVSGSKTWEVRKADRDFKVGDVLRLMEYDPKGGYTGSSMKVRVTYLCRLPQPRGYVGMSVRPLPFWGLGFV